ncbi:helix-turn-helix domain-containing protein [Ruegeria denitrificans]|uniref:helix-turn-helix domain-containing protein n=1 Tax=Ruegeria denitrificans TaxID=1715692 RepID=UPI0009EA06DD
MDIEFARTTPLEVETGSFFGAAEMVHITQSTVSIRVRPLEYQLGQPVFECGKSGAKLTPAGSLFLRTPGRWCEPGLKHGSISLCRSPVTCRWKSMPNRVCGTSC